MEHGTEGDGTTVEQSRLGWRYSSRILDPLSLDSKHFSRPFSKRMKNSQRKTEEKKKEDEKAAFRILETFPSLSKIRTSLRSGKTKEPHADRKGIIHRKESDFILNSSEVRTGPNSARAMCLIQRV